MYHASCGGLLVLRRSYDTGRTGSSALGIHARQAYAVLLRQGPTKGRE
jgi:hypothetical protein